MKYLSLFSGIGGFEYAIEKVIPSAICIGYSEIDQFANTVYQSHYPTHTNLGDVRGITETTIRNLGPIDLVVGGFPCQDLSSLSRNRNGFNGSKSILFFELVRILSYIPSSHVLIENNGSMTRKNREFITNTITEVLQRPVHMHRINANKFGIQTRDRIYWTTFPLSDEPIVKTQSWEDVLEPLDSCTKFLSDCAIKMGNKRVGEIHEATTTKELLRLENGLCCINLVQASQKTRFDRFKPSSIKNSFSATISASTTGYPGIILADYRFGQDPSHFALRHFEVIEIERLFRLPEGYVSEYVSTSRACKLLGNTVVISVIEFLINALLSFAPNNP